MPLTWIEDATSRSATIFRLGRRDPSTRQRVWNVIGTSDEDVLHADINAKISTLYATWTYPGQPLVRLRAESYSVDYQGDTLWRVAVQYEKIGADDPTQSGPLKRVRAFDTTGGTQTVTQGRRENAANPNGERRYGPGGADDAVDMKGAVNVDERGPNGVDIIVPHLTWTESYDVPSSYVTSAYIREVHLLTGSTNAAAFRGFAIGEVLFAGLAGSQEWDAQRGDGPWNLSYKFIASPNRGPDVGGLPADPIGDITTYNKRGHEFLWVKYATQEDTAKNQLARLPIAVYVNTVYPPGDFSKLGIGVA
jgi:hypothetical protein